MNTDNINCSVCHGNINNKRSGAEKRALAVVIITIITMVAEIGFGLFTGSMALLADGIHMGTHALALGITAISYYLARRFAAHNGFSFGTGKIGILAGYTNALLLGISAFFMAYESIERLLHPQEIQFTTAIVVTVIGLLINLLCALILGHEGHGHHHDNRQAHHHCDTHHHHGNQENRHDDTNMKGALLHVIADAMTSVFALLALFIGQYTGFTMLDPIGGLLGAIMILRWSFGLLGDTATILVDYGNYDLELQKVRDYFGQHHEEVKDLHIWRFGDNAYSLLVAVESDRSRENIIHDLQQIHQFDHLVVEKR